LVEKEKKRLSDALLRRGFSWSDIKAGLNRLGADLWED
jgi:SOS response regulatory protein OraA/RecX